MSSEEAHEAEEAHALYVRTILMLTLMVCSIMIIHALKMKGFHAIGETTLYVLIGLVVGFVFDLITSAIHQDSVMNREIQLSSNFFKMVLLPPIIFEGGFTLQRVAFIRNLLPILALALLGATFSTLVVSVFMYGFAQLIYPAFTFTHALVFGSIISSTDPVSVLGMLPPSTDRNLYMLIFGESALNDAVSIILYRFFSDLAADEDGKGITVGKFFLSFGYSIWIFVGSSCIGIFIGMLFAKMTKHVKPPESLPIFQLLMFLVFAYSSYLIADILEFTGIIAVFFCGAAMAHYSYNNLSKVTILSAKVVLRTFCSMCDAFVFLYLGLGLRAFGKEQTTYNAGFIAAAFVSHQDRRRIPGKHQVFLWYCGLRGAVAFALSVELLANKAFPEDIRALIFGTTVMVVFLTVMVLGGFTPYVMKALKLDETGQVADTQKKENKKGKLQAIDEESPNSSMGAIAKTSKTGEDGTKKTHQRSQGSLTTLDEYLKPEEQNERQGSGQLAAEEFMDAIDNGADPRRTRRQGATWYETTTMPHPNAISASNPKLREDIYEIKNNVPSALDDSDDEDDLDRISIAVAAEMIGIAGTTTFSMAQLQQSAVASNHQNAVGSNPNSSLPSAIPKELRSRASSQTSIPTPRRISSAVRTSNMEMQTIRLDNENESTDMVSTRGNVRSDPFVGDDQGKNIPVIPMPSNQRVSKMQQASDTESLFDNDSINQDDDISLISKH